MFLCSRLQVLLLSARNALLSRLVLAGRADAANSQRFARVAFGSFNPRTASNRSADLIKTAAEDMLQGSGVPELEERVLGFLFEAAAGLKLVAILDDMGRLMNEVGGVGFGVGFWRSSTQGLGVCRGSAAVALAGPCIKHAVLQCYRTQFLLCSLCSGEFPAQPY
jgi:hypothetical protein